MHSWEKKQDLPNPKCKRSHGMIRELKLIQFRHRMDYRCGIARRDGKDKEASDPAGPLWHHEKPCAHYPGGSRSRSLAPWRGPQQRWDLIGSPCWWAVSRTVWRWKRLKTCRPFRRGVRTIQMADEGSWGCPWERSSKERQNEQLWETCRRSQGWQSGIN